MVCPDECRNAPVSNENVRGRKRRIADGEEIEKRSVSRDYRDNWRDSSGQSEEGGKKGGTRHPKTGPVIPEIGIWNAGPRQELFPIRLRVRVTRLSLSLPPFSLRPLVGLDPWLRMPLSLAIIKRLNLWSNLDNVTDL